MSSLGSIDVLMLGILSLKVSEQYNHYLSTCRHDCRDEANDNNDTNDHDTYNDMYTDNGNKHTTTTTTNNNSNNDTILY